jgi:hypothetical protein
MTMLNDPEWGMWTDNRIAQACAVTQPYVAKLRIEIRLGEIKKQDASAARSAPQEEDSASSNGLKIDPSGDSKTALPKWAVGLSPMLQGKVNSILAKGGEPRLTERKGKPHVVNVKAIGGKAGKAASTTGNGQANGKAKAAGDDIKDEAGRWIEHERVRPAFNPAHLAEFDAIASAVSQIKKRLNDLSDTDAGSFIDYQDAAAWADNLRHAVTSAKPYCVCPMCAGAGCRTCRADRNAGPDKGLGWLPKQLHDQTIPCELNVNGVTRVASVCGAAVVGK